MARAHAGKWLHIGASLLVGLAGPIMSAKAQSDKTGEQRPARVRGVSTARMALDQAIEKQRRGDYEAVGSLLDIAKAGENHLTETERIELGRLIEANKTALEARNEAIQEILLAEADLEAGDKEAARERLRMLAEFEQYLSKQDQQRLAKLWRDAVNAKPTIVRGAEPSEPAPRTDGKVSPFVLASRKVQQAREAMARYEFDKAEAYAREADQLEVRFRRPQDSPRAVLKMIEHSKNDPKVLLSASRAALRRKEFDKAEAYAKKSEKLGSWTFTIFGDKPSKALTDIAKARATYQRTAAKPMPTGSTPGTSDDTRKQALRLLNQGRKALRDGDVRTARDMAEKARALQPKLHWADDNPTKLLAAVQSREARMAGKTTSAKPKSKLTKQQAQALLAKGRSSLKAGNLDDAQEIAMQLKATPSIGWGLFGDNPDRLNLDVQKARAKQGKSQAAQMLARGRQLLAEGKFEEATKAAYEAQKLHGSYSVRDLGDRPSKLLEDISVAKRNQSQGQPTTKPTAKPDETPIRQVSAPKPESPRVTKAKQWLAYARVSIRKGDLKKAREIADYVKSAKVDLGPNDDSPEKIYAELDRIEKVGGAIVEAGKTMPEAKPQPKPQPVAPSPELEKARKLLNEAKALQQKGHLLGAHRKATEAKKLGVRYPEGDDTADTVLLQLSGTARKFIEGHTQAAVRAVEHGQRDSKVRDQRFAEAKKRLGYAQQLAKVYGQDAQPVVEKIQWLAKIENPSAKPTTPIGIPVGVPTGPVLTGPKPTGKPDIGTQLLEQARNELRAGDLRAARKLAEDAYKGNFGVTDQAAAVLRSIDTEQMNQRARQACRTFDSAMAAYRRQDYAFASSMMASVDAKLLDAKRRSRLREVSMTPEMARASKPSGTGVVSQTGGQPKVGDPGKLPTGPNPPGSVTVSDRGKTGVEEIDEIKQLRAIRYQALQTKGLKKMRDAAAMFRAGQTDEALSLLEQHLELIDEAELSPRQVASLKRSVNSRLSQFKLLKAQQDWIVKNERETQEKKYNRSQRFLAEENKQEQVEKLMRQFNEYYRSGQYAEAHRAARQAHELDPDNAVVSAADIMAQRKLRLTASNKLKADKDEFAYQALLDAENFGDGPNAIKRGVHYDPERWGDVMKRPGETSIILSRRTTKEQQIERMLDTQVTMNFTNEPLYRTLDYIRAWHGLNIDIDDTALEQAGIDLARPVTIKVENISLRSTLNLLLDKVRLTWVIRDEVLQVTTKERARGKLTSQVYQVADLVIPVQDFGELTPGHAPLTRPIEGGNINQFSGSTPIRNPLSLTDGEAIGTPTGPAGPFGTSNGSSGNGFGVTKRNVQTREDVLMKLITSSIEVNSWREMGGPGTIDFFPLSNTLVINQTPDIQEQVADLLQALRRLQDQEVAVEIRYVLVSDDFYERMGISFQMNIRNEDNTDRFEPLLTSGNFRPAGFVNQFLPNRFLAGLTPAGTFTADLDIPIENSTFLQSIPPFGGYQPGVGGITTGLAFLSDIQVFMFLEAVQSDTRTNVMQAPRITMFNGQTATLTVSDTAFQVTNAQVTEIAPGRFAFQPQVQQVPIQSFLTNVQTVISADRRFVRLSISQNFQTLIGPGPVQAFPVTIPIFNAPGLAGEPVVLTQFIQQPRISNISVGTTVMVPDGGTVLLGGLKRLSEGRRELGPPVLSKIPYVNRLFKNVGYGRESASLMMMVTPRIIIQEEEEFRQTGFRSNPLLGTGQAIIPELEQ